MEQTPGWFSSPEILRTISGMETLGREMLEKTSHGGSPANTEIAVFVSEESAHYMRYNTSLIEPLINAFCTEQLPRIGAPYDVFMTSDLNRLVAEKLPGRYKLFIFLNAPFLNERERTVIREKIACKGHTVLWICCPGYISEKGLSTDNVSDLTGIKIVEEGFGGKVRLAITDFENDITKEVPRNLLFGTNEPTGPLFWCIDKDAQHIGEQYCMPALGSDWQWRTGMVANKTGLAVKEFKDWRSVWCGVPNIPSPLLRGIAKKAGAHVYVDTDDVVYANALLLAVHTRYSGARHIVLPRRSTVTDAFTRKTIAKKTSAFDVHMERGTTGIWLLGQ
jgi:hypothetical protein